MDIKQKFEEHLKMARDDYPDRDFLFHIVIAREWTESDVLSELTRIVDDHKYQHIDAVNKTFFE